jgi:hypothetical protein
VIRTDPAVLSEKTFAERQNDFGSCESCFEPGGLQIGPGRILVHKGPLSGCDVAVWSSKSDLGEGFKVGDEVWRDAIATTCERR